MSEAEYVQRIRELDRSGLLQLYDDSATPQFGAWPSGKAFEYIVLRAFELEGAMVTWPYNVAVAGTQLEQIDGAVHLRELACLVESKDRGSSLNIDSIAKLRNQLARRPAGAVGLVFSRHGFTEAAVFLSQFISPQTILLWEGEELRFGIENERMSEGLVLKYRHAVERGIPNYHIITEEMMP